MFVDVVDENDNIIGKEEENICHENKLWHRVAMVFIFRDDSYTEILLQKRASNLKRARGLLGFPGGHLIATETYLQGMLRELHEEMLVNSWLPNVDITPLFKYKYDERKEHIIVYRLAYSGKFNINQEEVENYYYFNLKDLLKDIELSPEKYSNICKLLLKEYKHKFIK